MTRIVIDSNALSRVFNPLNAEHGEYRPVLKCISTGKGIMVYGGSSYVRELGQLSRIQGIVVELWRAGKVVILEPGEVDREETRLRALVKTRRFDDHHIVAIVIVGKCTVICSAEREALGFFTDRSLYPKRFKLPKIYSRSDHIHLLRS